MATPAVRIGRRALEWRPLREDDIACVAAIEAQIHAAPWTVGNFRDALLAGYAAEVAERDGRIVAYGVLMLGPGEAQVLNVSVAPDARREGLGRLVVRRFLDTARQRGAEQVFLEVRVSNTAAIALYRSEGFAEVARRTGYYPPAVPGAAREDALIMRRALGERQVPPAHA
jgi:[ribosomal protein S18]-alanine N-acetyltransferase